MLKFNFVELKKEAQKKSISNDASNISLAFISNFSTQFIQKSLVFFGALDNLNIQIFDTPFDNINQIILAKDSLIYTEKIDYVVLCLDPHYYKSLYYKQQDVAIESCKLQIEEWFDTLTTQSTFRIFCFDIPVLNDGVYGNNLYYDEISLPSFLLQINESLKKCIQQHKQCTLLPLSSIVTEHGWEQLHNPALYIQSHMLFTPDASVALGNMLYKSIQCEIGVVKKCIVLDLDNTLWGGIVGDDGWEQLQIGNYGIGKAFTQLQQWLLQLKQRGILLAVCSKNNEEAAKSPFINHPEMVLRLQDIICFIANWNNKVDNILYIQAQLNISLNSIIFIDDNKFERNAVINALPEVTVPDLPEDPALYLTYLQSLQLFNTVSINEEDRNRTKLYIQEKERLTHKQLFFDEKSYLQSINMKCQIANLTKFNAPRLAQLSQRTNQFNTCTIRYTESELWAMYNNYQQSIWCFELKDDFGEHGIIALVTIKNLNDDWEIENWMMSCRVLNRGMESFICNEIVLAAKQENKKNIKAKYIASNKNSLVQNLYKSLGFDALDNNTYTLTIQDYKPTTNEILKNE